MPSLSRLLSRGMEEAFARCGLPKGLASVGVSQRPDLAPFQCNGCIAAAKAIDADARALAVRVAAEFRKGCPSARLDIAGPGFINIILDDAFLAEQMNSAAQDPRLGCSTVENPLKICVDFGGPNVAKPMHVGHLRSTIIGDSLQRTLKFLGHAVVSDIHLGDWGTQIGMVIIELQRRQPGLPYFAASGTQGYPAEAPFAFEDLNEIYPASAKRCKEDPAVHESARAATAALHEGHPGYRALWRQIRDLSVDDLRKQFGKLGVSWDQWLGESDAHAGIPGMLERLERLGLIRTSRDARVIDIDDSAEGAGMPPVILVKSDGAATYHTTDLATIEQRLRTLRPDEILYVVDGRQALHFRQLFLAARKARMSDGVRLEHVPFGTINGSDGKPFKTREGGAMRLADFLSMAVAAAGRRLEEGGLGLGYGEEDRALIARQVALAAVKFADLKNNRQSNYIFDLDQFTSFEGRTGPYILYAGVRLRSILRKARTQGLSPGPILPPLGPQERSLMLFVGGFEDAVRRAAQERAPHHLCDFVFELCQRVSVFYEQNHILSEKDPARQSSWLGLVDLSLRTVDKTLSLLGIEPAERM